MDASELYSGGFHPIRPRMNADFSGYADRKYSRTERPPKYYIIDFGLSKRFEEDELVRALERVGTDLTVPEYHNDARVEPFRVDVYCVGNMIRKEFLDVRTPKLSGFRC